ncbi:hypothetical protein D1831_07205 [Lactiplantibacillus garii]|uniref:Uncharacterized protein n=1 Tax=Lactiplantibacillus garii TaxID=2306423 RepID=A0A426D778_9LACO|nr:LasU family protein [Lactiplantibacillus garii]RRK10445.1 hypothetical protein D1831_07205 [Lactiplantibacillus garii]
MQRQSGPVALGLGGLFLDAFAVIIIDARQRTVRGQSDYDWLAKLFNGYFGIILVTVIIGSLYLMGHH